MRSVDRRAAAWRLDGTRSDRPTARARFLREFPAAGRPMRGRHGNAAYPLWLERCNVGYIEIAIPKQ
jgi:hypothetical protein